MRMVATCALAAALTLSVATAQVVKPPPVVRPPPPPVVRSPIVTGPTLTAPSIAAPLVRPPVVVIQPAPPAAAWPDPGGGEGDQDGDGWSDSRDCNDSDPTIHPGASERQNGRDDNCNGAVDLS